MQADQFPANEQTESQAGAIVVDRIGILVQAVKNEGPCFRADASTCIAYRDISHRRVGFLHARLHRDCAVGWSELDGVVDQIDKNFKNASCCLRAISKLRSNDCRSTA